MASVHSNKPKPEDLYIQCTCCHATFLLSDADSWSPAKYTPRRYQSETEEEEDTETDHDDSPEAL